MKKTSYFDRFTDLAWPTVEELEPFFLAPPGKEWSYKGGNDNWGFEVRGLHGTEHLPPPQQVTGNLSLFGHPVHGVYLRYRLWDGRVRRQHVYNSKGDLSRLHEVVYSLHDDGLPVGLFIPFRTAWSAVKEFLETDGALPKSIAWIADADLPPGIFPDPGVAPPR